MNELNSSQQAPTAEQAIASPLRPIALPDPRVPITVRHATMDDIPFMDRMQKKHAKALGFFTRGMFESYITRYRTLVADDSTTGLPLGYVASTDRYLKRDELGAVFQLCVDENYRRGFVAAALLKAVFEQSAYGCRLYCCWCAQDLPANHFWDAMGFVPLAYRAGSSSKRRVHIFWEKRIRTGDTTTPYWFPAKTEGGAIREDRIILPIPPGMTWQDELPVLVRDEGRKTTSQTRLTHQERRSGLPERSGKSGPRQSVRFGPPGAEPPLSGEVSAVSRKPNTRSSQSDRPRPKADPALAAKARELRDRWLEHVAGSPTSANRTGKYDVGRSLVQSHSAALSAA